MSQSTAKERQDMVLRYILRYQEEHDGAAPSQKTVYLSLGMAQWQVSRYIKKLEKAGELKRSGYRTPKAEGARA